MFKISICAPSSKYGTQISENVKDFKIYSRSLAPLKILWKWTPPNALYASQYVSKDDTRDLLHIQIQSSKYIPGWWIQTREITPQNIWMNSSIF